MTETVHNRNRLEHGGAIDRERPLHFTFNGRPYTGFKGDSLASALLANGVRVLGRSFKYHRPRGIFTAGEEEPCALVETGRGDARLPTCRAPMVPLREGLVATSQNAWPSVNFDLGRVVDFSHALWPAGFYNKTFKWPNWHAWEGMIRRSAGLGRPLDGPDPDHYEQVNAHCDLLVCGAGPSGLIIALTAARAGLRVILADQHSSPGGALLWENYWLNDAPGSTWATQALAELASLPNLVYLPGTTVSGIYDHNVTTLLQAGNGNDWRECLWTVRPRHVCLATGAIEQGLIFPGNDRPGIMLAGAVRHYLNRYAVRPGRNIVVATNNNTAYQTVFDLAQRQIPVSAVVDVRAQVDPAIQRRLADLGTRLLTSARIGGTSGGLSLREARFQGLDGSRLGSLNCDLLAVSGGWAARVHLLAHARGTLKFDSRSQSFLPSELPQGMTVSGCANGTAALEQVFAEAARTAVLLCEQLGQPASAPVLPQITAAIAESREACAVPLDTSRPRQWIDLAHDVTLGDAELAVREGFVSVEHFKRLTTTGMSVDQGKTGNLNALIALGALTGKSPAELGTTTFRPPYMPITLGAVAGLRSGAFYAPHRCVPAHASHQALGARMEDYGWMRPDWYTQPGETPGQAIAREVRAVRNCVGVFDNAPIGKLEVRGPDAAAFLHRMYMNNVMDLKPGRCRYGLMLNENGVIIDDGVFTRMDDDFFLVNTTSAGAGRIHAWMERWLQCEWRGMQVLIENVTAQWANFTLAGPRARSVMEALGCDFDLSDAALPHMSAARGSVAGLDARVIRVSFSGERSYEINLPARFAPGFLETVLDAGEAFGITPYGIEALMVLRMEKGYLHLGSDTDGSTTPDDVGWGPVARNKAEDYIGRRSLFRQANRAAGRKQLVGIEALDPDQALRPGSHLLRGADREPPAETDGWITSACFSPTLGRPIALAVVRDGASNSGETFTVCDGDLRHAARSVAPCFHDPENLKLKPHDSREETQTAGAWNIGGVRSALAQSGRDRSAFETRHLGLSERTGESAYRLRRLRNAPTPPGLPVSLPPAVGACAGRDPAVLCLGPDEWLIKGSAAHTITAAGINESGFFATDITDSLACFRLTGKAAPWLLAKLGGLDFTAAGAAGEHCARTRLQQVEAIIHYRPSSRHGHVFDLLVERGLAGYFFDLLEASAPHAGALTEDFGETA